MVIRVGREPDPRKRIRQTQGALIRKVRRDLRGMSIADFASAMLVTESAVTQWERGNTTPRQDKQVRIAQVLDVPWSTIFGLDAESAA